ncbi:MAG: DUF58 domain-containing protein [Planctomycetaceae bacterium]|nr:DUF58 domain-containing protein [Planctomycetaceae bacterium]
MEPSRSTLYRTFLISADVVLLLLGCSLRLPAFIALAAVWSVLLATAWFLAKRPLDGLRIRRKLYPSAFEGDEVSVELTLESGRPAEMIEVADAFGPSIAVEQRMLEPGPLGPEAPRRLKYSAFCSRHWGIHSVGPVQVFASDPLGLFHARRQLAVTEEFAVFPQVYDDAGLADAGARATLVPHDDSTGRSGQSLLSMGVREYRPGDDPRRVHWPATARRGSLMVKEYEIDLAPYYTVFLDLDRRHRAGTGRKSTLEYVLRTAGSVIWSAMRAGAFVQVLGHGAEPLFVPPGRGEAHLTFSLYELIRAGLDGGTPLPELVLQHLASVPPQSTVVLVSGSIFLDLAGLGDAIEALRSRGTRVLAFLVNNFSFPAISGWPPPRAQVLEKTQEVAFFLRSRGVPVRVLEEADDLEAVLGRGGPA